MIQKQKYNRRILDDALKILTPDFRKKHNLTSKTDKTFFFYCRKIITTLFPNSKINVRDGTLKATLANNINLTITPPHQKGSSTQTLNYTISSQEMSNPQKRQDIMNFFSLFQLSMIFENTGIDDKWVMYSQFKVQGDEESPISTQFIAERNLINMFRSLVVLAHYAGFVEKKDLTPLRNRGSQNPYRQSSGPLVMNFV